jgi:hypothetical protein
VQRYDRRTAFGGTRAGRSGQLAVSILGLLLVPAAVSAQTLETQTQSEVSLWFQRLPQG